MDLRKSIRIALFGPVSAGKSTLLNGLSCEQFSDMKIKRTTMLPQVYYGTDGEIDKEIRMKNSKSNKDLLSKKLTNENCAELKYNVRNISDILDLPKGVFLDVYDLPGLNDGEAKNIYFNYIDNNFHKFDIILLVIDIEESFNTKGTREILDKILENIKISSETYHHLMVLVNKCDDMVISQSSFGRVEYGLDNELDEMFAQVKDVVSDKIKKQLPTFSDFSIIPICGQDIFIYRMLKCNPQYDLDMKYINKIGLNEFSKSRWARMSEENKRAKIIDYIKNIDINDVLEHSGFSLLKNELGKVSIDKFLIERIKYSLNKIGHINSSNFSNITSEYSNIIDFYIDVLKVYKTPLMIDQIKKIDKSMCDNFQQWFSHVNTSIVTRTDIFNKHAPFVTELESIKKRIGFLESTRLILQNKIDEIRNKQNQFISYFYHEASVFPFLSSSNGTKQDFRIFSNDVKFLLKNNYENINKFIDMVNLKMLKFNVEQGRFIYLEKNSPIINYCKLMESIGYPVDKITNFFKKYILIFSVLKFPNDGLIEIKFNKSMVNLGTTKKGLRHKLNSSDVESDCPSLVENHKQIHVAFSNSYHALLDHKLGTIDMTNYDESMKHYLINLKITNMSHLYSSPDLFHTELDLNYYKHENIILQEFYFLLELYEKNIMKNHTNKSEKIKQVKKTEKVNKTKKIKKVKKTKKDKKIKGLEITPEIRKLVWDTYIGKKTNSKCFCCWKNTITSFISCCAFQVGYIISEHNSGKTSIDNLLPICKDCNGMSAMGKNNWDDYIKLNCLPLRVHGKNPPRKVIHSTIKIQQFWRKRTVDCPIQPFMEITQKNKRVSREEGWYSINNDGKPDFNIFDIVGFDTNNDGKIDEYLELRKDIEFDKDIAPFEVSLQGNTMKKDEQKLKLERQKFIEILKCSQP